MQTPPPVSCWRQLLYEKGAYTACLSSNPSGATLYVKVAFPTSCVTTFCRQVERSELSARHRAPNLLFAVVAKPALFKLSRFAFIYCRCVEC